MNVISKGGYVLKLDNNGKPVLPKLGDSIERRASVIADPFRRYRLYGDSGGL